MPTPQTSVVRFDSTDAGAPTLNNVDGSLIAVLNACLVNGYNLKTITSLVVAGGLATATCSAHGYPDDSIEEVIGATPAGLNGRKRITYVDANTFTFDATGIADGAATGTITAKRAPLGWTKPYSSGTTKAVYARSEPSATAMVLRIDDTGVAPAAKNYARAVMYESMTDVDTGVGPAPRVVTSAAGQFWPKGSDTATSKRWILIGDNKTFYLFLDASNSFSTYGYFMATGFGDFRSFRGVDAFKALVGGPYEGSAFNTGFLPYTLSLGSSPTGGGSMQISRLSNGLGGAVAGNAVGRGNSSMGGGSSPSYPSPVDNGCVILPNVFVCEDNSSFRNPLRGELRGIGEPLADLRTALPLTTLRSLVGSDRDWLVVPLGVSASSSSAAGSVAVDVTGPWG